MDQNHVSKSLCDTCFETDLGVRYMHLGKEIHFECRRCNPQAFERYSREDVDSWLNGGSAYVDP